MEWDSGIRSWLYPGFLAAIQVNGSSSLGISKINLIIAPKNKLFLVGEAIYCDNKFCAYAFPNKISYIQYYLWNIFPFYI